MLYRKLYKIGEKGNVSETRLYESYIFNKKTRLNPNLDLVFLILRS